jgi:hypothetical protein
MVYVARADGHGGVRPRLPGVLCKKAWRSMTVAVSRNEIMRVVRERV